MDVQKGRSWVIRQATGVQCPRRCVVRHRIADLVDVIAERDNRKVFEGHSCLLQRSQNDLHVHRAFLRLRDVFFRKAFGQGTGRRTGTIRQESCTVSSAYRPCFLVVGGPVLSPYLYSPPRRFDVRVQQAPVSVGWSIETGVVSPDR